MTTESAKSMVERHRIGEVRAKCDTGKVYQAGYDSETEVNPYEYNSNISDFCQWQAGYNDRRSKNG